MFSSVRALQQRRQLGLRNLSADQDTFARWPGLARLFDGMGRILNLVVTCAEERIPAHVDTHDQARK